MESVTLATIEAARERIGDAIHLSPCQLSHHLSERIGLPIYLKLENLQRTGSFKERGALNKLLTLSGEERKRGVIAASAGNHAQGVAFHATKLGIRSQIVMPQATPLVKVVSTRGFGAEVILHGANYDEACEEALARCEQQGLTFIHPFDDPVVIAGTGDDRAGVAGADSGPGSGGGADWRRRVDWRHCLRAEGAQSEDSRDWRGAGEAAFDAAGARGGEGRLRWLRRRRLRMASRCGARGM